MEVTNHLGLKKPGQDDFYNVEDSNYNADVIDEKIEGIDQKIEGIDQSIDGLQRSVANIEVPVKSVNDKTGHVSLAASDVGAVPTTRKVNNKALSGDISLTKEDVGLKDVQNYGIATTAEAQAGTVNNKYMTPALVKAAVERLGLTMKVFTSNGTFVVPDGVYGIYVTACGGGGGGGRDIAGGGGGAACIIHELFKVTPGQNITITVGKGGAGGTAATGHKGASGGLTSLSGLISLPGGGGVYGEAGLAGGIGGGRGSMYAVSSTAEHGAGGRCGSRGGDTHYGNGGGSYGGGGGGGLYPNGGTVFTEAYSNGGNANGWDGGYGAGGGGVPYNSRTYGGNGGDGIVIIEW